MCLHSQIFGAHGTAPSTNGLFGTCTFPWVVPGAHIASLPCVTCHAISPVVVVLTLVSNWRRKHRVLNVWVVFTFVALWHDMNWTLLTWAWLLALGFALWPASAHKEGATPTTPRQPRCGWWLFSLPSIGIVIEVFLVCRFLVQLRFHAPFQLAALSSAVLTLANFIGFFVGASGTWKLIQVRCSLSLVVVTPHALLCCHSPSHGAVPCGTGCLWQLHGRSYCACTTSLTTRS